MVSSPLSEPTREWRDSVTRASCRWRPRTTRP